MAAAFPGAVVRTSLYLAGGTFPEFGAVRVDPSWLNRIGPLRRSHRLALPLLAPTFSSMRIDADVTVCSSSGWAHAAHVSGRKVVYCHTPARWLYQGDRYIDGAAAGSATPAGHGRARARRAAQRSALRLLGPPLRRWDRAAAATADRYLANSTIVRDRIRAEYGRDAEVLPPPYSVDPHARGEAVAGIEPGFLLCVSRLMAYKNVGAIVEAVRSLPGEQLVVVGTGPLESSLRATLPANVTLLGRVTDDHLRWLYANAAAVVAASYEDFGLTPLEAAAFGRPVAVLRWGGFLDTTLEGTTGVFFDRPDAASIAAAIRELRQATWDARALVTHASRYSPDAFITRLRQIVADETGG